MSSRKKFGEILLDMGVITEADLDNALSRQQVSKKPLGQIFEELGIICDTDILRILSRQFNLKRIEELDRPPMPEKVLELVDAQMAVECGIFPFGLTNGKLCVATSDPLDFSTMDKLAFLTGLQVVPYLATPAEINKAIKRHYLNEALPDDKGEQRVLVVDDQEQYRLALSRNLDHEGYQVMQAVNGAEALKLVMGHAPQLILLETGLRGMDGKEVFRTLQTNSLTRQIPVIALSTRAYPEEEAQLLDMGFFDFIAKPYNLVRLLARVRRGLSFAASGEKVVG